MSRNIFLNLPVADLKASMKFFSHLGFDFNSQFSDETTACLVVDENIFVMLLAHEKFQTFTPLPISDATRSTEMLVALSCDERADVDTMVRKAVEAGGTTYNEPQDHGFMYGHGFKDLDGHIWEVFYMDPLTTTET